MGEEKLIEFIASLKRGKITILVSADLEFSNPNIYEIAKNSAVKLVSINKRIAFSKFKPFFIEKLQECAKKQNYFIKILYNFEEENTVYFIRYFNGEYLDDLTYIEDDYKTEKTNLFELFEPKKIAKEKSVDENEIIGKTHIVDSKEAIPTVIGMFLCEFSMMGVFVFPYQITILIGIVSGIFALIGMLIMAYHWLYVGDYYM